MKKIYITRQIPDIGISMLKDKGYEIDINKENRPLKKDELIKILKDNQYDAVLTMLTDNIDKEIMDIAPSVKLYANYAIGFNNFDLKECKARGLYMTNTPSGGAERVAEHTWALILGLACRIVEGDTYMREGKYNGWDPMLLHGERLEGKTLGIIGTGRIGANVARKGRFGFNMNVVYFDIKRNEELEKEDSAIFLSSIDEVLKNSDIVSLHIPLMESTHHIIDANKLRLMKSSAYIINTSRGPVIDEKALVQALKNNIIKGAALDVFEFEPELSSGLAELSNVILTPHIASATKESREEMSIVSAQNIIDFLECGIPRNNLVL